MIARLGGDEFATLMPEAGPESAQVVNGKIEKLLLDKAEAQDWPVTFRIGVVTLMGPTSYTVDEMIGMVDNLMYTAKEGGKNKIKHVS